MAEGPVGDDLLQPMTRTLDTLLSGGGAPLLPPAARQRRLQVWAEEALGRVEDEVWAARFQHHCPVPGAPRSAYQHRVLRAPRRPTLLAGIRFKGGDVRQPFVELLAWDRPIEGPRSWGRIRTRLAAEFQRFGPARMRVRWPGQRAPDVDRGAREVDQFLVAGRLATLRAQHRPWGDESVEVVRATDAGFHPAFLEAFGRWQAGAGALGDEVLPADEDTWTRCLQTGAVVCARAGGRWAGVMAAARAGERSIEGYSVQELFLDTPLRGRRRAPVLQRHLVDVLLDRGRDCLWGTIHGTNAPSLRAALRTGREVIETWWFVDL
jgi:hypothetical protein